MPFQETDHPGPCSWCSWCSKNAHPLAPGEQLTQPGPKLSPQVRSRAQPPVFCSFALCGPCRPHWAPRGSTLLIFLPRTSLFMEPLTLFPSTHTHTHTPHSAEQLERAWVGDRSCHLPQPHPWASHGGSLQGEFTGVSVLFIWGLRGVLRATCGSSPLARDRTGAPTLGAWRLSHAPPGESQSSLLFQDITRAPGFAAVRALPAVRARAGFLQHLVWKGVSASRALSPLGSRLCGSGGLQWHLVQARPRLSLGYSSGPRSST